MKQGFLALIFLAFIVPACIAQSTFKPKAKRQPWDTYIGVKGGVIYANMTALGGEAKITGTGGLFAEAFINKSVAVQTEITFARQGSHNTYALNAYELGKTLDYQFNYINTDLLIKKYFADKVAIYTGLHMARAFSMKCNYKNIRSNLRSGDLTVPVGLSFVWHNISLDARYHYPLLELAKNQKSRSIMGNSKNSGIILTMGYRVQIF